jgi:uncharacterized protein
VIAYLDASALAKKYLTEPDSREFVELWRSGARLAISMVGYAEVVSAIARRFRGGVIDARQHQAVVQAFKQDWALIEILDVDQWLNDAVDRLTVAYGLRGFDTIHLATALQIQGRLRRPILFATADRRLRSAARQEGFDIWPAKESP